MPITETRFYTIKCDECGNEYPQTDWSLVRLKGWAKNDGWFLFGVYVKCPDCQKEEEK